MVYLALVAYAEIYTKKRISMKVLAKYSFGYDNR